MRPDAAMLGDQPRHAALVQGCKLGGTERISQHHGLVKLVRHAVVEHACRLLGQLALQQPYHLVEILDPQGQVIVLDTSEFPAQRGRLEIERPFGVDPLVANPARSLTQQHVVTRHHPVGLEKLSGRSTAITPQVPFHPRELVLAALRGLLQPVDLGPDVTGFQVVFGQVQLTAGEQVRMTDRNTVGYPGAAEREDHSPSPKRSFTSATRVFRASFSSGPSHSISSSVPTGAASISTPMMDLALTRLSSRITMTSLWNSAAKLTSLLAARACRPSRLHSVTRSVFKMLSDKRGRMCPVLGKLGKRHGRLLLVIERSQQHRQVKPGQNRRPGQDARDRFHRKVMRRGSGKIGDDKRRFGIPPTLQGRNKPLQRMIRIVAFPDRQNHYIYLAIEDDLCHFAKRLANTPVRNDDNVGHRISSRW